ELLPAGLLGRELAVEGRRIDRALFIEALRAVRVPEAFGGPAAPVGGAGLADRAAHRRIEARKMHFRTPGIVQLVEREPAREPLAPRILDAARRLTMAGDGRVGAARIATPQRRVHLQPLLLERLGRPVFDARGCSAWRGRADPPKLRALKRPSAGLGVRP